MSSLPFDYFLLVVVSFLQALESGRNTSMIHQHSSLLLKFCLIINSTFIYQHYQILHSNLGLKIQLLAAVLQRTRNHPPPLDELDKQDPCLVSSGSWRTHQVRKHMRHLFHYLKNFNKISN